MVKCRSYYVSIVVWLQFKGSQCSKVFVVKAPCPYVPLVFYCIPSQTVLMTAKESSISETVQRLPTSSIVPFLQQVNEINYYSL